MTDEGREPTCTETGLTEGKHCGRCGEVLVPQSEIAALGHEVPNGTVTKEPTCAEEGEIVGVCTRCGEENVTGAVAKLPHTEASMPAVPATCAESGWTAGVKCSVCGEILSGHEPVWPLGHTIVTDAETAALTEGKHCSVCGKVLLQQFSKEGTYWTAEGNYDAALYASEPGDWVIEDAADLAALAKKVIDGASFEGCTITLNADIDLSEHIWVPIGTVIKHNGPADYRIFRGSFHGNLHKITGLRVFNISYGGTVGNIGLFGSVQNAVIRDVFVEGSIYQQSSLGSTNIGGVVGIARQVTIENCGFVGSIYNESVRTSFNQYVGGIVGDASESTLRNCFVIATLEVSNKNVGNGIGGIAGNIVSYGEESSVISNVYAVCSLMNNGRDAKIGGITSYINNTVITNAYVQYGFNVSGAVAAFGDTYCTEEVMKAVAGTRNDNVPKALVDLLNDYVLESGGEYTRAWVVDPAVNGGYPTFACAARFRYPGTELDDSMQIVRPGKCPTQPEDPVYEDYRFLGWYADPEFTTPFDFGRPIYETVTVYAKLVNPNHTHQFGSCILGADGLHDHVCSICEETLDCIYRQDVIEPTCQSAGYTVHTCLGCGASYMDQVVEGGHKWTAVLHEPTHTEQGYTFFECAVCHESYKANYTAPIGHSYDDGVVTREPTCTQEGVMTYTCTCGQTHEEPIEKLAHELEDTVTAPTCTELGFTVHACKHCDYTYTDSYVGALGHDWDEGTVAAAPTLTETGTLIQHCTRCDAVLESKLPMLTACDGGEGCPSNAYIDVPDASNWAHVGIDFVLKSGFFYGTSDTTFSPNMAMTRAMLVTVLYRLEGRPGITTENPFTDVPDGKWYTEAVIWAAEKGVVAGIGEGLFNPDGNVTREQIAVILRSYSAYKGYDTAARADLTTFPDHEEVSGWAYDALSWAKAEGLIAGAASNGASYLLPGSDATRAQVAAILMCYVKTIVSK